MIIPKIKEILQYYKDTYGIDESVDDVYDELIKNNVEVKGNSFYCPIWNEDLQSWILLAGSIGQADMWVMKKIIKLIKSGDTVYSMLNGNSEYLLEKLSRYELSVIKRADDVSYIVFNKKE